MAGEASAVSSARASSIEAVSAAGAVNPTAATATHPIIRELEGRPEAFVRRDDARAQEAVSVEKTEESAKTASLLDQSPRLRQTRRKERVASFSRIVDTYNGQAEFPAVRGFQTGRAAPSRPPFAKLFSFSSNDSSAGGGAPLSGAGAGAAIPAGLKRHLAHSFDLSLTGYLTGHAVDALY